MGVQARQLARFARKNNISVALMGSHSMRDKMYPHCVLGVLAHMANVKQAKYTYHDIMGLNENKRRSMEAGFENWSLDEQYNRTDTRYFKVGQNFARLMGLRT